MIAISALIFKGVAVNFLHKIFRLLLLLAIALSFTAWQAAFAQTPVLKLQHVRGVIERVDQPQGIVVVSGKPYQLSRTVRVVDKDVKNQPMSAIRPGSPVLLVLSGNAVDYLMLNPGPGDFMEGPSR